jgi:hypothetical protein
MKTKLLFVFLLAGLAITSAKTYKVTIFDPSLVAGVQLKPGDYRVDVNGSKAVFIDDREKTVAEAKVTVENSTKKFGSTAVETKQVGGNKQIEYISLGGTHMKLAFN